MPLWTVQPMAVWDGLRAAGVLRVYPAERHPAGWVHPQYTWLAGELRRRRLHGSRGGLPWFAYCARPDLRWVRHSRPAGSREVLLEPEPPFVAQLLSEESLRRTGYFDVAAVQHWRRAFHRMRAGSLPRLSVEMGLAAVTATQLWHHLLIGPDLAELPPWMGNGTTSRSGLDLVSSP